jgi:hypothetical protein
VERPQHALQGMTKPLSDCQLNHRFLLLFTCLVTAPTAQHSVYLQLLDHAWLGSSVPLVRNHQLKLFVRLVILAVLARLFKSPARWGTFYVSDVSFNFSRKF